MDHHKGRKLPRLPKPETWEGWKYGFWTGVCELPVKSPSKHEYIYRVLCECICGTRKEVDPGELLRRGTASCGCRKGMNISVGLAGGMVDGPPTAEDLAMAGSIVDEKTITVLDAQLFRSWSNPVPSGCVEWTGPPSHGGYGRMTIDSRRILAHRFSYAASTKKDPYGLVVRHMCNNRKCVNSEHLKIGTQVENVQDAVRERRMASGDNHGLRKHPERCRHGESNTASKLTWEIVNKIRDENLLPVPRGRVAALAREHHITGGVMMKIVHRTSWKVRPEQQEPPTRRQTPRRYIDEAWQELKRKYDSTCLRCGRREPDIELTADHVIPMSAGGAHTIDNIQPLCRNCNSAKNSQCIDYRPNFIGSQS